MSQTWFNDETVAISSNTDLRQLASQAEALIQTDLPRYDANYIDSFVSKSGKTLMKFGAIIEGQPQELIAAKRDLPANFDLVAGNPATITVDDSGDRPKITAVAKRDSQQPFDSMQCVSGQFRLNSKGFGFVDDVYVPHELADQIEDRASVTVAVVRRLDKRKNRWGMSAIAIVP